MSCRYVYATQVDAGPGSPNERWGLFFVDDEIAADEARARYMRSPEARADGSIGVVRLADGEQRPSAYLRIGPRANGVELAKLNDHGTVEASYMWGAYYQPSEPAGPDEANDEQIFLSSMVWYAYPDDDRFWSVDESIGSVMMTFREDGYAREETIKFGGFGEADDVTSREYTRVDVSANWFDIPEFGDWETLFHPEPDDV